MLRCLSLIRFLEARGAWQYFDGRSIRAGTLMTDKDPERVGDS